MYAVISPEDSLPLLNTSLCNECVESASAVGLALDNATATGLFLDDAPALQFVDDDDTLRCIHCASEEPYYD